ncbi:MAG: ectonucleotide pyrophosphatase/phosphodiesterase [Prevotellaceae bacterium]|jgi:predicted AlkP superfamily pyrophosphatase or phosphodiesterase|nr:ectonucleotide pyrophosphatase/phosphodiesterase [Prevotellaceae bacterium]
MRKIFFAALLCLLLSACRHTANTPHTTIIVSLDGFRWDYPQLYHTPNLDRMGTEGVRAVMWPSFPSSTFPNHYTLATGLVPDHHGIVNNTFYDAQSGRTYAVGDSSSRYDPYFYLGEPIWVTAQKQGVPTANIHWVGSDVPVHGIYPTYYHSWEENPQLTYDERVDEALAYLRKPVDERPRLIMLYYPEPDGAGHAGGPYGDNVRAMVQRLDTLMGRLIDGVAQVPDEVNLIITSDHGMTGIDTSRVVRPSDYLKPEWYIRMVGNRPTSIFSRPEYRDSIRLALQDVPHISVWEHGHVPAALDYGTSSRIGDLIVMPDLGWQFTDNASPAGRGAHGYDPAETDMQVIFLAVGPDFKRGYEGEPFRNVDVYSLLAHLLKVKPAATDGSMEKVRALLRE